MFKKVSVAALLVSACFLSSSSAFEQAQNTANGTVRVVVKDSTGAPVAEIKVLVEASPIKSAGGDGGGGSADGGGSVRSTNPFEPKSMLQGRTVTSKSTDKDGKVEFSLKPGRYRLSASNPSLGRAVSPITVEAGKTQDVTMSMVKRG